MKSIGSLAAALLLGSMFAGSANASSIIMLGDEPAASKSSIITLGDPDPCADNACGTEEDVAAAPRGDGNAALVDSFGMPTNMPVIMRPSMDTPADTAAVDPAASAPAAQPAPASSQPTEQPAPVVETPKAEPAPAVEQPVAEGEAPQQAGAPIER